MRAALLLLLLATGCGESNCEKLGKQCEACANKTAQANCETIVSGKVTEACQAAVDAKIYEATSPSCTAKN